MGVRGPGSYIPMKMIKPGIPKTTSSWPTEFTKPGLGQSMIPMNTPSGYDPQSILQPTKAHTIFCIYIYMYSTHISLTFNSNIIQYIYIYILFIIPAIKSFYDHLTYASSTTTPLGTTTLQILCSRVKSRLILIRTAVVQGTGLIGLALRL